MREKFMFFQNFMDTANKLPDDMRLKYYDAIMDYVFNGNEPSDPIMAALINSIKPSLDKEETRGGNHNPTGQNQHSEVKSGQKGQKRSKGGQSGQSFLETETETEIRNRSIEKEIVKEKVASAPRFTKPTFQDVQEYVASQGFDVDSQSFIDFYESKGWKVGSSPMKDWKAAVRNWSRRELIKTKEQEKSLPFSVDPDKEKVFDPVHFVDDKQFFIDDTMPEYKDVLKDCPQETVERAYKWILKNKYGVGVYSSWVCKIIDQFKHGDMK